MNKIKNPINVDCGRSILATYGRNDDWAEPGLELFYPPFVVGTDLPY